MDEDKTLRAFLTDAPTAQFAELAGSAEAPADDAPPTSWVQLAKLGSFKHPRYGPFKVTRETFASFIKNFAAVSGGEVPMDYDHSPETSGDTRAAGWIKELDDRGDELWGRVEWTWMAAYSIREREYRYISPTWVLGYSSDDGTFRGPTLLGAALTNRPYFERMAVVSLSRTFSREDTFAAETAPGRCPCPDKECSCDDPECEKGREKKAASVPVSASDSRGQMSIFANIAQTFGLPAEADEAAVVAFIKDLQDKASKAPGENEIVVNAETFAGLTSKVNALETDSLETRFSTEFAAAITAGKLGEAQREAMREVFDRSPESFTKVVAALPAAVSTAAQGASGHAEGHSSVEAADEHGADLDQKVQAYMAEHKVTDYAAALDAVTGAQV